MISVGDMVQTGVFVLGNWQPMSAGRVVSLSNDRTVAEVDIMSHHGGRPWIVIEATSHLRKVEEQPARSAA